MINSSFIQNVAADCQTIGDSDDDLIDQLSEITYMQVNAAFCMFDAYGLKI